MIARSLSVRFALEKPFLVPGSKARRWADMRWMFGHYEGCPLAAALARVEMIGQPKTRERWKTEFRHQRILIGIGRGKDYERILWLNTGERDFPDRDG